MNGDSVIFRNGTWMVKIEKAFSEDRQASENAFCVGNAPEPGVTRALVTAYNPGNYLCILPVILDKPGKVRPREGEP